MRVKTDGGWATRQLRPLSPVNRRRRFTATTISLESYHLRCKPSHTLIYISFCSRREGYLLSGSDGKQLLNNARPDPCPRVVAPLCPISVGCETCKHIMPYACDNTHTNSIHCTYLPPRTSITAYVSWFSPPGRPIRFMLNSRRPRGYNPFPDVVCVLAGLFPSTTFSAVVVCVWVWVWVCKRCLTDPPGESSIATRPPATVVAAFAIRISRVRSGVRVKCRGHACHPPVDYNK